jgi:small basic protein
VPRSSLAVPCKVESGQGGVQHQLQITFFLMSQIYVSAVAAILAQVLPHLGVTIGNEELTGFITTGVTICAALWVMIRRVMQGDIGVLGGRKS